MSVDDYATKKPRWVEFTETCITVWFMIHLQWFKNILGDKDSIRHFKQVSVRKLWKARNKMKLTSIANQFLLSNERQHEFLGLMRHNHSDLV